ncbi:hypothetical protein CSUI_010803 [Cystoisospora suis]|uniref:Uncharacterized protein n=1 Tax=Cystoisospora suis TaxID=483139 RepID=A0A2C6KC49_9APIC|nr:hypothetical protein CSUI_010803 [Cystoisospora suis]
MEFLPPDEPILPGEIPRECEPTQSLWPPRKDISSFEENDSSSRAAATYEERDPRGRAHEETRHEAPRDRSPRVVSGSGSDQSAPRAAVLQDREGKCDAAAISQPGSPSSSSLVYSVSPEDSLFKIYVPVCGERLMAFLQQIKCGDGMERLEEPPEDPRYSPPPDTVRSVPRRPPVIASKALREEIPSPLRTNQEKEGSGFCMSQACGELTEARHLHLISENLDHLRKELSRQHIDLHLQKQHADTHREQLEALRRGLASVDTLQSCVTALEANARALQEQLVEQDTRVQHHHRVLAEQQHLLRAQAAELSDYVSECEDFFRKTDEIGRNNAKHQQAMQLVQAAQAEELRKVRRECSNEIQAIKDKAESLLAVPQMVQLVEARTDKLDQTQSGMRAQLENHVQVHEELLRQVETLEARQAEALAAARRDAQESLQDAQNTALQRLHEQERKLAADQEMRYRAQERQIADLFRELTQLREEVHLLRKTVAFKDENPYLARKEKENIRADAGRVFQNFCGDAEFQPKKTQDEFLEQVLPDKPLLAETLAVPVTMLRQTNQHYFGADVTHHVGEREQQAQQHFLDLMNALASILASKDGAPSLPKLPGRPEVAAVMQADLCTHAAMILRCTFDAIRLVAASPGASATRSCLVSRLRCSTEGTELNDGDELAKSLGRIPDCRVPVKGEEARSSSHLCDRLVPAKTPDTLDAQQPLRPHDSSTVTPDLSATRTEITDPPVFATEKDESLVRTAEAIEAPLSKSIDITLEQSHSSTTSHELGTSRTRLVTCTRKMIQRGGSQEPACQGDVESSLFSSSSVCSTRPTTASGGFLEDAARSSGNLFVSEGTVATTPERSGTLPTSSCTSMSRRGDFDTSPPHSPADAGLALRDSETLPNDDHKPAVFHVGSTGVARGTGAATRDVRNLSGSHSRALEQHPHCSAKPKTSLGIGQPAVTTAFPDCPPAPEVAKEDENGVQHSATNGLSCNTWSRGILSESPDSRMPQRTSMRHTGDASLGGSSGQSAMQFSWRLSASGRETNPVRQILLLEKPHDAGGSVLKSTDAEQQRTRAESGARSCRRGPAVRLEEAEGNCRLPGATEEVIGARGVVLLSNAFSAVCAGRKAGGIWGGEGRGERMEWRIDNFIETLRDALESGTDGLWSPFFSFNGVKELQMQFLPDIMMCFGPAGKISQAEKVKRVLEDRACICGLLLWSSSSQAFRCTLSIGNECHEVVVHPPEIGQRRSSCVEPCNAALWENFERKDNSLTVGLKDFHVIG